MESLKMKINASKFASLWRRERRRGITMLSLSQVPVLSMLWLLSPPICYKRGILHVGNYTLFRH